MPSAPMFARHWLSARPTRLFGQQAGRRNWADERGGRALSNAASALPRTAESDLASVDSAVPNGLNPAVRPNKPS